MPIFARVIRLLLAALWIYAGAVKLHAGPQVFALDVMNYEILPWSASLIVAWFLPMFEVVAGLALLTGKCLRGALLGSALMALVFAVALGSAWARGLDITCGCFGENGSPRTNYPLHIAGNFALIAASAAAATGCRKKSGQLGVPGFPSGG